MAPFSAFSAEILAMVNFLFFLSLHPPTFEQEILELFKERADVNPNAAITGDGTIERRWRSRELTPCELGRKAIEEEELEEADPDFDVDDLIALPHRRQVGSFLSASPLRSRSQSLDL